MKEEGDFIKWFFELNKNSGAIAGGKGANLAEIYNLKLPVPVGFVVTAQAYDYFIKVAGIIDLINEILENIDFEDTKQLEESAKKIREYITNSKMPKEMELEILEAYENLNSDNVDGNVSEIINKKSEPISVAVRSSATTEDLEGASFAGQQETFVNIKGKKELLEAIKKCFASLFTARAAYYRNKKGFGQDASLAVIVQKMIDSDKSGVIFSMDPSYRNNNVIIEAVWGLGEGIVSGAVNPDRYVISRDLEIIEKKISNKKIAFVRAENSTKTVPLNESYAKVQVLTDYEIKKLADYSIKLEAHYKKPQDIEFAIESDKIYLVQTRPITTIEKRIEKTTETIGESVVSGIAASPGIASGKVKIIKDLKNLGKIEKGDVLITEMTNPDMVVAMQKCSAIVTNEGGMTAHAAIVSREMGIPCVVGTENATEKLKENEIVTVNGFTGNVYRGKIGETTIKEVLPAIHTNLKIKVMVDLPSFAERAAKTKIKEVGLTRIEGIISESGKHPKYFLENNKINDYEKIIFNGINKIAEYFDEIWVRTSDIRTDEFQNLQGSPVEKEANPMLGMHGVRYSMQNPDILRAELNALNKVSKNGKIIGVMVPQLISVEELKIVKKILKEINFKGKTGVMIETPAAVQIIKELCEEGIDFISFGTNDLTQYTLAIDRGNEDVQYLYTEMHPAVLNQLKYVIDVCEKFGVETSICGQAGSEKEMVKFLLEAGIDSISVNADAASEISEYVSELEGNKNIQEIKKEQEENTEKESDKEVDEINEKDEDNKQITDKLTPSILNNEELTDNNISKQSEAIEDNKKSEEIGSMIHETPNEINEKVKVNDNSDEINKENFNEGGINFNEEKPKKTIDIPIEEENYVMDIF